MAITSANRTPESEAQKAVYSTLEAVPHSSQDDGEPQELLQECI